MEAIATNVKQWEPTFHPKLDEREGERSSPTEGDTELLSFTTFDIKQVYSDHIVAICLYSLEPALYKGLASWDTFAVVYR